MGGGGGGGEQLPIAGAFSVRLRLQGAPIVRVVPERVRRSKSPMPDERCQRRACIHLKQQLATATRDAAEAHAAHDDLHRRWRLEVEGAVRCVHAELAVVQDQLEAAQRAHQRDASRAASVLKQLKLAEQERSEQAAEIAQLKAELAGTHSKLSAAARHDRVRALGERRAEAVRAQLLCDAARKATEDAAARKLAKAEAAAEQRVAEADERVRDAEQRADDAASLWAEAQDEAERAQDDAMTEQQAAKHARGLVDSAEICKHLAERRAERAQLKVQELKQRQTLLPASGERSVDDWAALGAVARRKAAQRERDSLEAFLKSHAWRLDDLAAVLG